MNITLKNKADLLLDGWTELPTGGLGKHDLDGYYFSSFFMHLLGKEIKTLASSGDYYLAEPTFSNNNIYIHKSMVLPKVKEMET